MTLKFSILVGGMKRRIVITSSSQNSSWACLEAECDMKQVSSADDTSARTNARFRPRNAPSAYSGDSKADVFTKQPRDIDAGLFSLVDELIVSTTSLPFLVPQSAF